MLIKTDFNTYRASLEALLRVTQRALRYPTKNAVRHVDEAIDALSTHAQNPTSYRSGKNMALAKPHEGDEPLFREALAAVCDSYGLRCTGPRRWLSIVMINMAREDRWRAVLVNGHDAYAFARNILTCVADGSLGNDARNDVLAMAGAWLCAPGAEPFELDSEDKNALMQDLATAMFGAHWWMFNYEEDVRFNPDCILRLRPPFLPGVLPEGLEQVVVSLPDMECSP
jgi:hypothetical protein